MEKEHVVEKVVNYIELHLMDDLPLSKIAAALHYSKFYMARVFAENTGVTVYKYIQGRRLTIAARQLVESDRPAAAREAMIFFPDCYQIELFS